MVKQHIRYIISLLIVTVCILTLSGTMGKKAIEKIFLEPVVFEKSTKIASIEVSNLTKEEVQLAIVDAFTNWKAQSNVRLYLKEEPLPFSIQSLQLLVDETLLMASSSTQNALLLSINMDEIKNKVLELTSEELNWEMIYKELITPATFLLPMNKDIYLEDYFIASEQEIVLSQVVVTLSDATDANIFNRTIELENGNFSLQQYIQTNHLIFSSPNTPTELASAIFETLLPTNIEITERYTGATAAPFVKLGFECLIDKEQQLDLKWFNPNREPLKLKLDTVDQVLTVQLIGKTFLYSYELIQQNEQSYDFTTLNQFSNQLKVNNKTLATKGQKGKSIEIVKIKKNKITNEILEKQLIKTSYAPQPEIWVYGPIDLNPDTSSTY